MDRVIFRKWNKGGAIIAILPDEPTRGYPIVGAYEHVGQHGDADYWGILERTKPAQPAEYHDLLEELKSIGYEPRIMQKLNRY